MSLLDEWLGGGNDPNDEKRILSEDPTQGEQRAVNTSGERNGSSGDPHPDHSHENTEDPHRTSDPILPSDLLLPTDLPLPDIKWWVDLEFLDLASGPPANVGSHMQDKYKSKNSTLDYHFPDIFFDTTSSFADIGDLAIGRGLGIGGGGSANAGGLMGGDQLDPERDLKTLLADLFPPASAVSGPEVGAVGSSVDVHHPDESTEESVANDAAEKLLGFVDLPAEPSHDDNEASAISVQSPSKDATSHEDMVCAPSQSLRRETVKEGSRDGVYSVPMDVLQTISKDFSHLQTEFEKSNEDCGVSLENEGKRPAEEDWLPPTSDPLKKNIADGRKTLRIKSIRTLKTNQSGLNAFTPQLEEHLPPAGTVARVEIRTDRARNKTIFTILPALGGGWLKGSAIGEPHSFTVNTCNLAKATKLIKPLHLERLPILRDILETSIRTAEASHAANKKSKAMQGSDIKSEKLNASLKANSIFGEPNKTISDPGALSLEKLHFSNQSLVSQSSSEPVPIKNTQAKNLNPTTFPFNENDNIHNNKVEEDEFLRGLERHGLYYDQLPRIDVNPLAPIGGKMSKMNWACPENGCERNFQKLSKLKIHIFSHRNIRPYKCETPGCSWAFHTAFKLKRHQSTAHADKDKKVKYECKLEKCVEKVKVFSSPYNLNQHLKRHARPLKYKCPAPGCEVAFQTRMELKSHLKSSIHRSLILQNLEDASVDSGERLIMLPEHICHSCGKRFFNSKDLLSHIHQFHGDDNEQGISNMRETLKQKYKCTFERCDKVFELPSRLASHVRTHTGERPYPCPWASCGWSFRTASKLRRHERTHKNERKNTCPICSKAYFRPEHLKAHMLAIHNPSGVPEPFVCPLEECGKRFSARSTLYVHMKRHTGGTQPGSFVTPLFRCVIESCGQRFYDRHELRNHVSLQHVQELAESAAGFAAANVETDKILQTGGNALLGGPSDLEAAAAAAELDFIALLSSVGDDDDVIIGAPTAEQINGHHNKDYDDQLFLRAKTKICGTEDVKENKPRYEEDQLDKGKEVVITEDENEANMGRQIKSTEDQLISEMIIETLTSNSNAHSATKNGTNSNNFVIKQNVTEKPQLPMFSHFICKNEKQQMDEPLEVSSVLISPFSKDSVQPERSQNELITVDASAITPVKLVSHSSLTGTSNRILHQPQTHVLSSISPLQDIIHENHQTHTTVAEKNNSEDQSKNMSDIHLPSFVESPATTLSFGNSLMPSSSFRAVTPNVHQALKVHPVMPKGKRKAKNVSILKCNQQTSVSTSLLTKPLFPSKYINKEAMIIRTSPAPDSSSNITTSISERKRPSILRRPKYSVNTISNAISPNISLDTAGLCDNSSEIQFLTETVKQKKRSPKKQKLLNNTLKHECR